LYAKRHPPPRPVTVADVAFHWRSAMSYTLFRVAEDQGGGYFERLRLAAVGGELPAWVKAWDDSTYLHPPHPSTPAAAIELDDVKFVKLLYLWLAYWKAGGGPLSDELARFPTAGQWEKYWPEVRVAWQAGSTPANFRARCPPAFWEASVRVDPQPGD
jgi:hypothetical protein